MLFELNTKYKIKSPIGWVGQGSPPENIIKIMGDRRVMGLSNSAVLSYYFDNLKDVSDGETKRGQDLELLGSDYSIDIKSVGRNGTCDISPSQCKGKGRDGLNKKYWRRDKRLADIYIIVDWGTEYPYGYVKSIEKKNLSKIVLSKTDVQTLFEGPVVEL
jgi:hypothetical protein